MGVTATVELPTDTCPLGTALRGFPDSHIRIERTVPTGTAFLPYFWTDETTVQGVTEQLEAVSSVEACSVVDVVDDEALVRVEWAERDVDFLATVERTGGTVVDAVCTSGGWTVTVQFDDHADLGEYYRQCVTNGVQVSIASVRGPTPADRSGSTFELTEPQRQALLEAYESGYFDVPRRTNLDELATELDVSDTAVSQRLRRGTARLVDSALVNPDEDSREE
ncbi:MAG: helix-turn-helix domain-containing protein [archaeon]